MVRKKDKNEYIKTYKEQKIYYSPTKEMYVADLDGLAVSMQYLEKLEELIDELGNLNE